MKTVSSIPVMQGMARDWCRSGKRIACIPTMGALHQGHMSLVDIAKKNADIVVMSIFVNPTQFAPHEDLAQYPRPIEQDLERARMHGVDAVFLPSAADMYHLSHSTWVTVEEVTAPLEGALRPDHFRGVTTVVAKLFNAMLPDVAVFGQKDAQQASAIRRMVRDLNMPIDIVIAPIAREADGLALSSRNIYLTYTERFVAPLINAGLERAKKLFVNGECSSEVLKRVILDEYAKSSLLAPDYISVADWSNMGEQDSADIGSLISVAVRMAESGTRLLDNIVLT